MKKVLTFLFSILCTCLFPKWICDTTLNFTNSFFSLIFAVVLFLSLSYSQKQAFDCRMKKYAYALGFIFSVMIAFGFNLENNGKINYKDIWLGLSIFAFSIVCASLLCILWFFLIKAETVLMHGQYGRFSQKLKSAFSYILERRWLLVLIILFCWIPCYISAFSGNFKYDAEKEFNQSTNGYIGDFPLLHSFIIIRLLSLAYNLTGSYNIGIVVYVILQMVLMSLLFAHMLCYFKKQGVNSVLLGIMGLYYALFPAIHLLVTCTVRDVMFSALLTYSMFLFYQLAAKPKAFLGTIKKPIYLAVILVLTILSRNNNTGLLLPIALIFISLLIFLSARKSKAGYRGAAVFTVTVMVCYFAINFALISLCQPLTPAKTNSSLAILSQPIVRAYVLTEDEWTESEKEEFEKYFN